MAEKYWADVPPEEFEFGETYSLLSYGSAKSTPVRIVESTGIGDYSGDSITLANYETIKNRPDLQKHVAYGTLDRNYRAVIVPTDRPIAEAITKIEDALDGYPIIDENKLSEIEFNLKNAAWEAFGQKDFVEDVLTPILEEYIDETGLFEDDKDTEEVAEEISDELPSDAIFEFWHKIEDSGDYVTFVTGAEVNFRFSAVLRDLKELPFEELHDILKPIIEASPRLQFSPPANLAPL